MTSCGGFCLAFQTDLKHLVKAMHKCVIPAEGLAPSHYCLWVNQSDTTHSVTLLCLWGLLEFWLPWGYFSSSDTGKQSGEKLNPAASCIQWVKWWSIHSGQDAALHGLILALRQSGIQQSFNGAYYLLGAPGNMAVWETITSQLRLMFTLLVLSSDRKSGKILCCN